MKTYKEYGETILDIIYVAPGILLKIPLGEVPAARIEAPMKIFVRTVVEINGVEQEQK